MMDNVEYTHVKILMKSQTKTENWQNINHKNQLLLTQEIRLERPSPRKLPESKRLVKRVIVQPGMKEWGVMTGNWHVREIRDERWEKSAEETKLDLIPAMQDNLYTQHYFLQQNL